MKFSLKIKWLITVFIFVLCIGDLNLSRIGKAQRGRCGNQTTCTSGEIYPFCLPAPTSLPPVSSTYSGGYGFRVASSYCGARRCYYLFACSCGAALGAGICTPGSSSTGACSPENEKRVE